MFPSDPRKAGESSSGPRDRKGGLSCAECRRSKLKCDRVFPCQSCVRRGCAHICPEGTLAATKGNKVLMAHAQRLTEQVRTMSVRIQELETALSQHSEHNEQPFLLSPTTMKTLRDADALWDPALQEVSDAIGSLSVGMDGQAKYHGVSAGSEYFQDLLAPEEEDSQVSPDPKFLGLSFELVDLMNAFPFGLKDCPYTRYLFVPFLPSRERTMELADIYYKNVAWMYDPIVSRDFLENIVNPIYGDTGYANLDTLHPHRISVFFVLLATGVLYESHPSSSILGEKYYALARAALSLESILNEATCATVQALFMMIRYIYSTDRTSNETRWMLTGVCCRVAQTIGLQRDSAGWNLPPDEVQRRRIMFWELYTYDAWTSLVNGRPPALNFRHTDCRFPDDLDPFTRPSGSTDWGWHAWKFRYSACCLSITVQHIFSTNVPRYALVLELDKKIRKFPLPSHLQSPLESSEIGRAWSLEASRAMQQYCAVCERESNLLYIHRSYFAQAIREDSANPLRHRYAPSVLATYRSACRLISSLKGLYAVHNLASRVWFFWSAIFSSCIVLGALVVESPGCTLSRDALRELELALVFYDEGSRPCRPPSTLTMVRNLWRRAYSVFTAFHTGVADSRAYKPADDPNSPDELEVLGGRKSVISNKSQSNTPSSKESSSSSPRREALMEYYEDLDKQGFDQGRDYEMVDPAGWYPGGVGLPYSVQHQTAQYEQSGLRHELPGIQAPVPVHSLTQRSVVGDDGHASSFGYPTRPGPDSMQSQPHPLLTSSELMVYPNVPSEHSLYPAQHQRPRPDPTVLGVLADHELNQEDVWRNFMRELGLQNTDPQAQ